MKYLSDMGFIHRVSFSFKTFEQIVFVLTITKTKTLLTNTITVEFFVLISFSDRKLVINFYRLKVEIS